MNVIIKGDIHEEIKHIPDNSIDMIYNDPPFATTENEWDKPLRWEELFNEMWRVLKPDGVIALHCSMPFTYQLIKQCTPKYHYIWVKDRCTNFFHAKRQPLRKQEEVLIYYKKQPTDNPEKIGNQFVATQKGAKNRYFGKRGGEKVVEPGSGHYGNYPVNVLNYPRHVRGAATRPDALVDYFIKTYTNPGEKILDLTCYDALCGRRADILDRECISVDLNPQVK